MLVVGFSKEKKTFTLQGSLGSTSNDNGFLTISFDEYEKYAYQAFAFNYKGNIKGGNCLTYAYSDETTKFEGNLTFLEKN